MAKKKEPLTKVQKAKKRDNRLLLLSIMLIVIPVIMMLLGVGTPGKAFH